MKYTIKEEETNYSILFRYMLDIFKNRLSHNFTFIYKDKNIKAIVDTMYDSDNCLDLDDPDYEEYNAIAFENLETKELFEMGYMNMPEEIYDNDKLIFKKVNGILKEVK